MIDAMIKIREEIDEIIDEKYPNDNNVFIALNNQIDQNWRSVSTYRVGGEYRLGGISLRAGYHLEESPYNNKKLLGDISGSSYGIGFNLP